MKHRVVVLATLVGLMQMPANAADWYIDIAYADGGDTLADVSLVDEEGDTSSDTVTAGGGPSFALGLVQPFGESFSLQAAYGYKEEAVRADNGSSSFKRMTLDLLAFWRAGNWRLGGGYTQEMSPRLHVKYDSTDTDFDDANGTVFELGYYLGDSAVLALRRTLIEYDATVTVPGYAPFDVTTDGDNWSVRVAFIF